MTPTRPKSEEVRPQGLACAGRPVPPDRDPRRDLALLLRLGRVFAALLLLAGLGALLATWFHPPALLPLIGLCALAGGGRLFIQNGLLVWITAEVQLYTPGGLQRFSGAWARLIAAVFGVAGLATAALGLFLLKV